MNQQDKEALIGYFGEEWYPISSNEAHAIINNSGNNGESFSPAVYLALQNLLCKNMGGKVSPKKKDRQEGQRRRKLRTGSRRG
ncbi:MAG: hypothetical protein ABII10_02505 [Candidatus Paceibacterota bacterium]